MFVLLLTVTFAIAFFVSFLITLVFSKPVNNILTRIIDDEISNAWSKYLTFAIYVTGISSGVKIWKLEKYINPSVSSESGKGVETAKETLVLNSDRWILEIYRTIIETMQGIAWMLLVFFVFALIAYVIVRVFGGKKLAAKN